MQHLRFLHIPKTAGTTFTQVLNNQFKNEMSFQFTGDIKSDLVRLDSLPIDERDIALYTGHAPICTGIDYIDAINTITFLREPVSRVQSFCQHVSEGKSAYLRSKFPPENFDLDKFLNSRVLELSNLQTKMLVNQGASAVDFGMQPSEALKKALDNLFNKITAYGLVEYFDESLLLFKQQFKWSLPVYKMSNTKNKDRLITFEPQHIERIQQINTLDIELYKQARERFIETLNSHAFNQNALTRFRKINGQPKFALKKYQHNLNMIIHKIYQKLRG